MNRPEDKFIFYRNIYFYCLIGKEIDVIPLIIGLVSIGSHLLSLFDSNKHPISV